ncbi:MAG: hypothetical protein RBQ72_06250 [Desulfobacterium sp.]|jgi:hypothetical protein|nr:hypothetical protein [Desulfobacterium sp.]
MGVSVCLGRYTNGIIIAGAVLFIVSDALIAYPMHCTFKFLENAYLSCCPGPSDLRRPENETATIGP